MSDTIWFAEDGAKNVIIRYRCLQTVYSGRSRFARIDIVDTAEYGRMLFLDGIAQSAAQDEFIYHESLVHPPMLMHPNPRSVCVIGGAEGATIREVSKYPQVSRIVMVDIDEELVGICRQHLSSWSEGAYDDHRLELHFADGRRFLEQAEETFDVIIVDLSDPTEDSPAVFLFTREFYQVIFRRLSPDGIACFQGEDLQPTRLALHARMVNTLSSVFKWVVSYPCMIPSFHEMHSLILASKELDTRTVDLGHRLRSQNLDLHYLTPFFLQGLLCVPGYVERAYAQHPDLITDDRPSLYQV
ncbi:MAG: fused MFS/spermidine synthase [Deltaproteobacteria bacterium]|nr:MAG: fused MFS/spermidine synthase [Deltaproteobacteria bacterium]